MIAGLITLTAAPAFIRERAFLSGLEARSSFPEVILAVAVSFGSFPEEVLSGVLRILYSADSVPATSSARSPSLEVVVT